MQPTAQIIGSPDPLEVGHLKLIGADYGLHASGSVQNDGLAGLLGLVQGHDRAQGCIWMWTSPSFILML